MAKVPNGPSKTGNPSGKGRGNNPSKKHITRGLFLVIGLWLSLSFNASGQLPTTGITYLTAEGSYISWGEPQQIKLSWSIYELDPIQCDINFSEKVSCCFNVQPDDYKKLKEIASKFGEWIDVARQNNVTNTLQKIPVDLSEFYVRELVDGYNNREYSELPCLGAYFQIKDGKTCCQITFRATREALSSGFMPEQYYNYGMQFDSPQEVLILAECLDYEQLNNIKWGDEQSAYTNLQRKNKTGVQVDTNQLFK